ncbi:enoyl-CoA hydratase/isomerase family protein [Paludibacterium purpuratum]|uniref:2-(1,2-epoxy-1,2-dihydrophenyl)acetyl-CoA isomerase n=1 Tax=Paludibacterium purpuratum TaxID=1144873 RepID=A0A4R7AYH7_9NEIS|nr:enoyl-CoA hydratase-related protein [Paludibacterium purpuratum]TDR71625.1 2-(1,2-epoxy-1,2-dihydrophenyl)acetyl-CoA isomerase [Paludibacterium purpuratum]
MNDSMIDFSCQHGIAHITLNRPAAFNALNTEGIIRLAEIASQLSHDRSLRAVIMTGAGDKAFCAGGDVATFVEQADRVGELLQAMTDPLNLAITRFMQLSAPVIAAVNGVAAGVGLSLVAMADLAIAVDGARFNTAYTQIGYTPDGGSSWLLPRLIGQRRAMELYLTNRTLSAAEASAWGLVNQVVAADALADTVDTLARRLADGPTGSFGGVKRLMLESQAQPLEVQLALEARTIIAQSQTTEGREGVRAFVEKRPARFRSA